MLRISLAAIVACSLLAAAFGLGARWGASQERARAEVVEAQKACWKAFFETLDGVVKAPDDLWPEQSLLNAVARARARELLGDPPVIVPSDAENPYAAGGEDDDGWGEEEDDVGEW